MAGGTSSAPTVCGYFYPRCQPLSEYRFPRQVFKYRSRRCALIALTYEGGMMIKTRRNWPCVRLAV
jgi:hypothetical protein